MITSDSSRNKQEYCVMIGLMARSYHMWTRFACGILLTVLLYSHRANGFNLNEKESRIYKGPPNSYFGYSIATIENGEGAWLLVGAPRSASIYQRELTQPGAVYKCSLDHPDQPCEQICFDKLGNDRLKGNLTTVYKNNTYHLHAHHVKEQQYFGATLLANRSTILACSPLIQDEIYYQISKHQEDPAKVVMLHGACYTLGKDFTYTSRKVFMPLSTSAYYLQQYRYDLVGPFWRMAYGQVGFSAGLLESTGAFILGSPGINDWTGGAVIYGEKKDWLAYPYKPTLEDSLTGYAVSSGSFGHGKPSYIASAPRLDFGKVYIFDHNISSEQFALVGKQFGSYFGASLCTVDLDKDGVDDVLVGAPLYRGQSHDEGRVYVYMSIGSMKVKARRNIYAELSGSQETGARFGSSIAPAGDLNGDSYPDVAIGAPYEEGGRGCIYIYQGYKTGLWNSPHYTQRVCASQVAPLSKGFGFALHGDTNFDRAEEKGVAVGAYGSDEALFISTRPVVSIGYTLNHKPAKISVNEGFIKYRGKLRIHISVYFKLVKTSLVITGESLEITMEGDSNRLDLGLKPRGYFLERPRIGQIHRSELDCPDDIDILNAERTTFKVPVNEVELAYCFILNENEDDVMTPMAIRSSIKVNPNNSKNAVQDVMISPNITITIPYLVSCGQDNLCQTDVSLEIKPQKNHFMAGSGLHVSFNITVRNGRERAYLTIASVHFSSSLQYAGSRVIGDKSDSCVKEGESNKLRCRIGHPLMTGTEKTIVLTLKHDVSSLIDGPQEKAGITVNISTASEDTNRENNYAEHLIPVLYKADPVFSRKTLPSEIYFERTQDENATNGTQNIYEYPFQHFYEVENRGPGAYPAGSVELSVPTSWRNGEPFASAYAQIKQNIDGESVKQTCELSSNSIKPQTGPKHSKLLPTHTDMITSIQCNGGFSCLTYTCQYQSIPPDDILLIEVRINMSIPLDRVSIFTFVSNISTTYPDLHDNVTIEEQVETVFIYKKRKATLSSATIPLAILIGLAFLGVFIFGLFKCGFFKRTLHEEAANLLNNGPENADNFNEDDVFTE